MNFKKISALACAMTIAGGVASAVPAYAAAPANGTTPVTYDNRQALPDGNAEYGIIIPTAVSLTDTNTTGNADLEITGINGFNLSDWSALTVQASVQSQNEYQLRLNGTDQNKFAKYGLKYDGTQAIPQDATKTAITKTLGVGGDSVAKVSGEVELGDKSKATEKGQYKDTLTYSFQETANTKA
ncbi:hypothetical protein QJR26_18135 (plasmid) [Clostridium baratii]